MAGSVPWSSRTYVDICLVRITGVVLLPLLGPGGEVFFYFEHVTRGVKLGFCIWLVDRTNIYFLVLDFAKETILCASLLFVYHRLYSSIHTIFWNTTDGIRFHAYIHVGPHPRTRDGDGFSRSCASELSWIPGAWVYWMRWACCDLCLCQQPWPVNAWLAA